MSKKIISTIKWRHRALADIERLHDFLKHKNPDATIRAVKTIMDGGDLIESFPFIGRPMPDNTGRREFFVSFGSGAYVLRYKLDDDETPIIIRVWHNREERGD